MRILLADDSVTAQNMGKKILTEAGHEVICVSNGAAALKKMGEEQPDLVILDIYMPGYGGLEVCQRLKENPGMAAVPVVLTVGKLEPFRKEDAQRARAEALIVKPFEASELQAAVARFAELAASAPPRAKSKAKPGQQSKAGPEQYSEDDYVTASQREGQREQEQAAPPKEAMAESWPQPQAAGTSEFEVTAGPAEPTASLGADATSSGAEDNWPVKQPAEFRVEREETSAPRSGAEFQPASKAAAAAAGAEFGGVGQVPGVSTGIPPEQDFVVAAPSEPQVPQASAFSPQIAEETTSLPGVPSSGVAPGFAAAEEPAAMPEIDPAFDPDRTQWATQFATRFGIPEEPATEEAEPERNDEPASAAASTPPEEIAAILSNLPGGMKSGPEPEEAQADEPVRPWPVQASEPANESWKAEEVPVEDQDNSVSLADEMEKAFAKADRAPSSLSEAELPTKVEEPSLPPVPEVVQAAADEGVAAPAEAVETKIEDAPLPSEVKPIAPAADQIAGVMQSAAMAIATRATISAVTSQLHTQPAEEETTRGPSAIEDLVGQVLERLKPKLIAEIKRELKTPDEK